MALAIFDLDNTLLAGDSDYLWGQFLVQQQLVDADRYEQENRRFYEEYKQGELDINEFLAFSLQPLAQMSMARLQALHQQFMAQSIEPILLDKATALLDRHRQAGDVLLIITATNRFVTQPIAERLGVDDLLATEAEIVNGRYTGQPTGIPCFQDGKVKRLNSWLAQTRHNMEGSWFYSDSHNDLPLLEVVDHPVAVDPDDTLAQHAEMRGWPVISLRD
ncbi:MAG: HAD family hydrolase [Gammaproteobacteria bacterium]